MKLGGIPGVPNFVSHEFGGKTSKYCLLIPIINEHGRIENELFIAQQNGVDKQCDIIICDGGSTDGSANLDTLKSLGVNTALVIQDDGKLGSQLRMGLWWALQRNYDGFITIDGNNKDSIDDVHKFVEKLEFGYDFVQGSRFIRGGKAINTPLCRLLAIKFIHTPLISLISRFNFTDTTNGFRAYSRKYIEHQKVKPFRDLFVSYELLAYLSVRASQVGLRVCEVPVTRAYPKGEKIPTKIPKVKGNIDLLRFLFTTMLGRYNP